MANTDYNSLKRQVEAEKKALEKERKNLQNDYENNIKSLNELRIKSNKEFDADINILNNKKDKLENKSNEILEEHYWLKY